MNNNYERPVAFVIPESAEGIYAASGSGNMTVSSLNVVLSMSGTDGMAVEKGLSLFRGQESMEQFLLQSILIILLIR